MPWLEIAARLPGKCLQIGVALWYLAGVQKTKRVALGNSLLKKLGVDRKAKARCLKAMQQAGLILIEPRPGTNPRVTLLDAVETDGAEITEAPTAAWEFAVATGAHGG